jgi:hypothetical protein
MASLTLFLVPYRQSEGDVAGLGPDRLPPVTRAGGTVTRLMT